jgi:hypothetical protein
MSLYYAPMKVKRPSRVGHCPDRACAFAGLNRTAIEETKIMNVGSKTVFAREVKKLVERKLFNSAETLCSLFVSHLSTQSQAGESVSTALAEVFEIRADCLLQKGEDKRALQYFRSAAQQRKSTLGCKYRHRSPVSSAEDARLRLKECRCLVALQDTTAPRDLRDPEGTPAKFRDVKFKEVLLTPTATEVNTHTHTHTHTYTHTHPHTNTHTHTHTYTYTYT